MAFTDAEFIQATQLALQRYALHNTNVAPQNEYIPRSDWEDIFSCPDGAVQWLLSDAGNETYAFLATTSSGNYTIDWGDGTIESFASGVKAQHAYVIGSGKSCALGYTTFKCKITGNLLTLKPELPTLSIYSTMHIVGAIGYVYNCNTITQMPLFRTDLIYTLLEFIKYQSATGIINGSTAPFGAPLKYFYARGLTSLHNQSYFFNNNYYLEFIDFDFSHVTSFTLTYARMISEVDLSEAVNLTTLYETFLGCTRLSKVILPTTNNIQSCYRAFYGCEVLQDIDISMLTKITSAEAMFLNCVSLRTVKMADFPYLTTTLNMFSACYALTEITTGNCNLLTNTTAMFTNCRSLYYANINGLSKANNAYSMFNACYNLVNLVSEQFAKDATALSADNMFNSCERLKVINLSSAKLSKLGIFGSPYYIQTPIETININASSLFAGGSPQIQIQNTAMTATNLNTFFTSLPTVTGKTINITGTLGAATCDRTIATSKGWTVVG